MKLKDIYYYAQGKIRYKLFYSKYRTIIPFYLRQQIIARVNSIKKQCYNDGQCTECGCSTTALQMCNKACDGLCYPAMLSRIDWSKLRRIPGYKYLDIKSGIDWQFNGEKFIKV